MPTTIKDSANAYVPKSTKNIAELKSVSVDLVLMNETANDSEGKEFSYNYTEVDGEKYRIPDTVLKDLKAILQRKPSLKNFAVNKTGDGRNTKYTVIPLD
jgi:hypothetical protein